MSEMRPDRLLGVHEVAEYLGVSAATVYALWRVWRVPFRRLGKHLRISRDELDAWYTTQPPG